jgi:glycosyltransferase involved in cell wall biosynthesis
VHLVYPHGSRVSTPDAIGRHLAEALRARYDVKLYDWDDTRLVRPGPDDVLLGHPHPAPWTIFRRSSRLPGWRRVIGMSPYMHGQLYHVAYVDSVIRRCDLYLAITGPFWFDAVSGSPFSHWAPKLVHMDLAVDRVEFPPVKRSFNEPGRRRIVYIGHSWPMKNPGYLTEISGELDGVEMAWIGTGPVRIEGFDALGTLDFADPAARDRLGAFDLMLTVGNSDSNPTTVLEAMAWGLIPVCTPESGYVGFEGIRNVPLGDARRAAAIIRGLLAADESQLRVWQETNWRLLDERFTWTRFGDRVVEAIESDARPSLDAESLGRRAKLHLATILSPHAPFRRSALRLAARAVRGGLES